MEISICSLLAIGQPSEKVYLRKKKRMFDVYCAWWYSNSGDDDCYHEFTRVDNRLSHYQHHWLNDDDGIIGSIFWIYWIYYLLLLMLLLTTLDSIKTVTMIQKVKWKSFCIALSLSLSLLFSLQEVDIYYLFSIMTTMYTLYTQTYVHSLSHTFSLFNTQVIRKMQITFTHTLGSEVW